MFNVFIENMGQTHKKESPTNKKSEEGNQRFQLGWIACIFGVDLIVVLVKTMTCSSTARLILDTVARRII